VTIRARLLAAIVLTVLGPVVTIGVALSAFATLGDRFDDVERAGARQRIALDLKFAVTDMNGWQTAYGYAGGEFRDRFVASAGATEDLLARAQDELGPSRTLAALDRELTTFMELDDDAWTALQDGRPGATKRILLGPEVEAFESMARSADALAEQQNRQVAVARTGFDEARDTARGASWSRSRSAPAS
jgi:hypothetical protein